MSELKATPGPWFISGSMTKYVEARIGGGWVQEVAACGPTDADGGYGVHQQANAHLIAAAPELYEALEETMSRLKAVMTSGDYAYTAIECALHDAHAALAKARGEQ